MKKPGQEYRCPKDATTWLMRFVAIITILIATAPALASQTLKYSSVVLDVLDGDTIIISNKVFKSGATIRYIGKVDLDGIDSPELDQPGGTEAKAYLVNELKGKTIYIIELTDGGKSRGGWVFRPDNNQNVNLLMVKKGLAWARKPKTPKACSSATLTGAQMEAQKEKRGLWHSESPVPPWEWLKEHPPKKGRQSEHQDRASDRDGRGRENRKQPAARG